MYVHGGSKVSFENKPSCDQYTQVGETMKISGTAQSVEHKEDLFGLQNMEILPSGGQISMCTSRVMQIQSMSVVLVWDSATE